MVLTFSYKDADGQRIHLLDAEGREVTLSVEAADRTTAINSEQVRAFIDGRTETDLRVRRIT